MRRAVVSSYSGEVEDRLEDFLTDMRGLAANVTAGSSLHHDDDQSEVIESSSDSSGQDRLMYHRARGMGLGMAGMVAFSIDCIT
ncbi:hypothetical protein [Bombella saccharophila]|uniref:Uncharacterized protein n=1 Tax=Bombella saccharophila TaxID=2967338 RepID=A0ABT3W778_9PROT|nr:hypothetical protein [Bombella saccharophila]MCX5614960.1 hypothetical protein [Bombella saccharophila]PHI96338.1 hypothetical protein BG621_05140 [Parasaccharibacter apium]